MDGVTRAEPILPIYYVQEDGQYFVVLKPADHPSKPDQANAFKPSFLLGVPVHKMSSKIPFRKKTIESLRIKEVGGRCTLTLVAQVGVGALPEAVTREHLRLTAVDSLVRANYFFMERRPTKSMNMDDGKAVGLRLFFECCLIAPRESRKQPAQVKDIVKSIRALEALSEQHTWLVPFLEKVMTVSLRVGAGSVEHKKLTC